MLNDFVVVPVDKASKNIALVCKIFYASVIAKVLGLYNNSSAGPYSKIKNLFVNETINKNIKI